MISYFIVSYHHLMIISSPLSHNFLLHVFAHVRTVSLRVLRSNQRVAAGDNTSPGVSDEASETKREIFSRSHTPYTSCYILSAIDRAARRSIRSSALNHLRRQETSWSWTLLNPSYPVNYDRATMAVARVSLGRHLTGCQVEKWTVTRVWRRLCSSLAIGWFSDFVV